MLPLFRRCCSRARAVSIWSFRGRSPSSRSDHADRYVLNFGGGSNATFFNERHVLDLQSVNFLKPSLKSTLQSKMETSEDSELVDAAASVRKTYEVGQMIAEALSKVGHKGVVTLEEGRSAENSFYVVEGMQFDRGYITPYFVTDSEKMAVEYENCKLLILEGALRGGYPVVIIAEDIELEALATLVVNKLRGSPKIAALKAPGFGDCKSQYLDDIAILTRGTVIREEVWHTLDNVGKEVLGHASKVVLTKYTSTIVGDGSTQEAVNKRVAQIKNLIEAAEQDYEKEKLSERIAKLSGGVAVIQVGAQTETELKEKKLRAEDFFNTTMIVVGEGIVVGGECIILRLASKVDAIKNALDNDEEKVGEVNVKRPLGYPLKLIAINAGVNGSVVSEKVLPSDKFKYGYNAATGNYEGLMAAGIIDPTKVGHLNIVSFGCSISKLYCYSELATYVSLYLLIVIVCYGPRASHSLEAQNLLGSKSSFDAQNLIGSESSRPFIYFGHANSGIVSFELFNVLFSMAMSSQKILCRSYATARFVDCYEARAEGLLKDEVIRFCRDIICSCLNRLERGIMDASFDLNTITHNGVSYSLNDGSDPIIPTQGVGHKGGLYLLLKEVLGFRGDDPQFVGNEPELAILFFKRLTGVTSAQMLRMLFGDIYMMGKKLRVKSICNLVQSFRNFAPADKVYYYNVKGFPTYWRSCMGRSSMGSDKVVKVLDQLSKISDRRIRIILKNVYTSEKKIYSRPSVSSCIECMRHSFEHCNQRKYGFYPFWFQLSADEVIHGLNEAFHDIYPDVQRFLNTNERILEVDPSLFFAF
ncbi:hypothetical protein M0R45_005356 [Rubus argutus]|uniref:Uncharacterized protein n=1 Tax=Rubus argutus TaxID=59490 RepID=A0AAW1YM75_RUBAR